MNTGTSFGICCSSGGFRLGAAFFFFGVCPLDGPRRWVWFAAAAGADLGGSITEDAADDRDDDGLDCDDKDAWDERMGDRAGDNGDCMRFLSLPFDGELGGRDDEVDPIELCEGLGGSGFITAVWKDEAADIGVRDSYDGRVGVRDMPCGRGGTGGRSSCVAWRRRTAGRTTRRNRRSRS